MSLTEDEILLTQEEKKSPVFLIKGTFNQVYDEGEILGEVIRKTLFHKNFNINLKGLCRIGKNCL